MPLTLIHEGPVTRACLDGELTIGSVDALQDELKTLLNHKQVQIDVAAVTEIDGCGCQMLGLLAHAAQERQRQLLILPGNPLVDDALKLLGLSRLLQKSE